MKRIIYNLIFTCIVFCGISANAQIKYSGKVTDNEGELLPGVSVKLVGTSAGTVTDVNGVFAINASVGQQLELSYIGFKTIKIPLTNVTVLTVKLEPDATSLDQVVVVGYGTQKRGDLIGSVAQVSAKDINNRTSPALSNALTGQLAGVTLIQRSGQPGSDGSNIQIRGVGSFGAGINPLILVDGIPVNSFNDVNVNDVSSISVLKDASTAAIYGSRAANGVILVTTKSGEDNKGKLKIAYNGYTGFQRATAYPDFINSAEFAMLYNEAEPGAYTEAEIQKFRDGSDPDNYPNSDWVDLVLKKSTAQTAHNLSISNKTENTDYLVSFGYLFQDGILERNDYNRYNLRLNLKNNITKKITLTSRLSGAQYVDNQPAPPATLDFNSMVGLIGLVVRVPSTFTNITSNGDFGLGSFGKGTPFSIANSESFYKSLKTDILINERLDYEPLQGLKLSVIGAYTQIADNRRFFLANQRLNANVTLGPGNFTQSNIQSNYKTFQQLAEYKNSIGKHQFGVLGGHTYEFFGDNSFTANRGDIFSNTLTELPVGSAATQSNNGTASENALDSYFARVNYTFANKYLIEGTFRYDGSSRFGSNNKYAPFSAAAVGWRISEEKFLKNKFSWLNDLKIKASYGTLGNQNIGNYPYQNSLTTGYNYSFGNVISSGVANITLNDPNIKWESTRTQDIGLELTMLKSLNISATYFDRYTYDILVSPGSSISNVLGFNVGPKNNGKLSNKGLEITAAYTGKMGDLGFNINTNFTYINNKVLDFGIGNITQPNGLVGNGNNIFIGFPLDIYFGYTADGLFTNQADIDSYSKQTAINPIPKPGDIRYKDISGPDGAPDGKVDATYDRSYLGSNIPKYNYGINLSFNYKNLDLAINGQGVADVKGQLSSYAGFAFINGGNIQKFQADNRWSASNPNPNAKYPRLEILTNAGSANTLPSSFYLLNASYFKIRSIQLGYSLPKSVFNKLKIQNLRFNLSAQNPLAFHNYPEGWDPETNTGGSYYPILANYTFGINLNF